MEEAWREKQGGEFPQFLILSTLWTAANFKSKLAYFLFCCF